MVNPLEGVLHARYMGPRIDAGTNNYGDQEFGSLCPPPLIIGKSEAPNTSRVKDVSRGTFQYFNRAIYLGGRTLAGPETGGGMAGLDENSNINKQAVNRVVSFMAKTYALIGSGIHEYDDSIGGSDNGAWDLSHQLIGKLEGETNSIGLYPIFSQNNTPYLITAYNTTGSNWVAKRLNGDTKVWENGASASLVDPNDAQGGILTECQHKGRIYFLTSSTTSYFWYDFLNESFGSAPWGATVRHPMELCSFMGHLFAINKDASLNINIYNLHDGGAPTLEATYPHNVTGLPWGRQNDALSGGNEFEGRPLMFVDNVFDGQLNSLSPVMYTAYACHAASARPDLPNESSQGLNHTAYRSDGVGGLIEVNTQGAGLGPRANPFKSNQNQEGSWLFGPVLGPFIGPSIKDEKMVMRTYVDQKTRDVDLSGRTAIVIGQRFKGWLCGNDDDRGGGGDFTNQFYHKFAGSGNTSGGNHPDQPTAGGGKHAWEFIGFPFKGTRHRAAAHERLGGGSRHHILDGNNNRIADIVYRGTDTTNVDGIIRIKYSLVPSIANPSGSSVAVRWFYDENQHAPEDSCTLVGTSHGALSGVNIAAAVTIDPNETYHVDWDAKGDGLTRGGRLFLNGMVILADVAFGPILSPSGIGGLAAWFEADDGTTITSGVTNQVSSWLNKTPFAPTISGVFQSTLGLQPLLVENANNGLAGVRFRGTNSEFLFANESPILSNDASTIMVIYEPTSLTAKDTMFSLAQNSPMSGTITDVEFLNASVVAGGSSDLLLEAQDRTRRVQQILTRDMTLVAGGETGKARLLMWTEIAFESESFVEPLGATDLTDIVTDGIVESSGLQNTTFGRFTGALDSGVYTSAGQHFDGTIYEVAVYDRSLSDIELDRFKAYAEAKYTLTL